MFISDGGIQIADIPTLTKHDIREAVWTFLEENDLANFPRPVKNRIPNFKGAGEASHRVADLECFRIANTVKVNPDKAQEEVRFLALEARKTVLVPTPRLRHGLFNRLEPPSQAKESLRACSQSEGVKRYSVPVGLDAAIKVDLIVIGSVAVSRTGRRIGKGEGFADLEYAMMRLMKAVTEHTIVVTTVHDCQVFGELPSSLFGKHDVPVDLIVTPTQVIPVALKLPKPEGIYWEILTTEKFKQIPILRTLRERELSQGKDVTLAADVDLSYEERGGEYGGGRGGRGRGGRGRGRGARRGSGRKYSDEREFLDYDVEDNPRSPNIQVTINVNKKNKIVRRTVEQTTKKDRVGSADPLDIDFSENAARTPKPRKPRLPITYSIFLGKVPSNCRVRDLKDALQGHDVHPVDILWRGKQGYAFARFTSPVEQCNATLQKLTGLKLVDQPIIVEKAKDKADMKAEMEAKTEMGNMVEARAEIDFQEKGVTQGHQVGIPAENVGQPEPQPT